MFKYIIMVGILAILYWLIHRLRDLAYEKLVAYKKAGNCEAYYREMERPYMRLLYPIISYYDLRANVAMQSRNKKECGRLYNKLCSLSLRPLQKELYYQRAFNYFVSLEDKENAKKYLDLLDTLNDPMISITASRLYSIYVLKSDEDLDDLLIELERIKEEEKGPTEQLIAMIYHNRGDKENANTYQELASKHYAMSSGKSMDPLQMRC